MGTARYIGRGHVFNRLKSHKKAHQKELVYFSFYIVEEKQHEREIETLLIRAAGPQLEFNDRKKGSGSDRGTSETMSQAHAFMNGRRNEVVRRKRRNGRDTHIAAQQQITSPGTA